MKKSKKVALYIFRLVVGLPVVFEFLNWVKVLGFSLDFSWYGLVITNFFAWILTEIVIYRKKNINLVIILPLIALSIYLDAFGDIFHFYSRVHNYDKFLHFGVSAIIAYSIYEVLNDILYKKHLGKIFSSVIIISFSSTLGMVYEIEEYSEDYFINHKLLRM
ncbi:MAG: hypothetical protein PHZ26_01300 [Candidatus Gracilibacteria bacterium]|nr:hypothetical protein [Candidatus Gracilibacteria bacterium]MDD2908371.1 hypothetical protein [Candidatus Gracilibacteria bacterium]